MKGIITGDKSMKVDNSIDKLNKNTSLYWQVDPRAILAFALSISTVAVFLNSLVLLSLLCIISLSVSFLLDGLKWRKWRKIKGILYVVIFVSVWQSILSPSGICFFQIGSLRIVTEGGLVLGASILLRMIVILSSGMILSTCKANKMIQGMVQWKVPYEIAFMTTAAIRFLPLLMEEMKDSLTAIQLRGVVLDKIGIRKRLKVYTYLLLPVVASTLKKAEELTLSMETKGFRANPERTSRSLLILSKQDYVWIVLSIVMALGFGAFQIISF